MIERLAIWIALFCGLMLAAVLFGNLGYLILAVLAVAVFSGFGAKRLASFWIAVATAMAFTFCSGAIPMHEQVANWGL